MRISLDWLGELVEFDESPETLAEMLSFSGTKVEAIERPSSDLHGVVVAEVMQVLGHPNADNLSLVDVAVGDDIQRVVCGAGNFTAGDKVPLARVGARLKGLEIGARKIRGQVSEGMLCSAAELGIGIDHSGILIMPSDSPVGEEVVAALGLNDVILQLELTLNRPDCTGMIGIAREVAALVGSRLQLPDASVRQDESLASPVSVTIDDPVGCTRYVARYLEDIESVPAPHWMQSRLLKAGVRSINSVVDSTNYVLLETGHPLHAFDASLVADRSIAVRRAAPGESIRTLDGVDRKLDMADLLIADGEKPLAIAGVMGSEGSEVNDDTTGVILESAHFDPASIAFTSRRHSLRTEASSRFEKGADPEMAPFAAARAARMMVDTAGARLSSTTIDEYPSPPEPRLVPLRTQRTRDLLGVDIADEEQVRHLESIELTVQEGPPKLRAHIPTFRPDLTREVDLIEEVARLAGLHRLPSTVRAGVGGGLGRDQELERVLKRTLSGAGMQELWTSSFSSPQQLDRLGLAADDPARNMVWIANPSSECDTCLRTTLFPALLEMSARNAAHRAPGVAAYEVARTYQPAGDVLPEEELRVGLIFSGRRTPAWWGGDEERWDLFSAKGIVESMARSLAIDALAFETLRAMPFHPTRAASVWLSGRRIGNLGEIHPEVCDRFEAPEGTVAAELAVQPLIAAVAEVTTSAIVDRFPPVYIDVAFTVDESVPASVVGELIAEAGLPEVTSVRLFDLYQGEQVGSGSRSLAFALELRAPGRTMTDEEALAVRDRIVEVLADRTGATLRG